MRDFLQSDSTVKTNWELINEIIGDKWSFPEELEKPDALKQAKKNQKKAIILKTQARSAVNPFEILYRRHCPSLIGKYLNYLFNLDPHITLTEGLWSLGMEQDEDSFRRLREDYGGLRAAAEGSDFEILFVESVAGHCDVWCGALPSAGACIDTVFVERRELDIKPFGQFDFPRDRRRGEGADCLDQSSGEVAALVDGMIVPPFRAARF